MNRTPVHADPLTSLLKIEHAIIQAPMAGGTTTPQLVAAVCNAGALGSLGAAYMDTVSITTAVREIRRLTGGSFAVNLFADGTTAGSTDASAMLEVVAAWHQRLGLPKPELPAPTPSPFPDQFEATLAARPAVFSFTFGVPDADCMRELRRRGIVIIGTATTVDEARAVEEAGADAVVAQGSEAGAHRGTFLGAFEDAMIGTMALVPQIVDAVRIPVIASGGIMDGRGIVAAHALGAAGVQLGTAFLLAAEAGTAAAYRRRLLQAREDETVITRAFSGRPARGIRNAFIEMADGVPTPGFPLQNALTRPMRAAAAQQGVDDALSLWAGQGLRLAREQPAAELVRRLLAETEECRARLLQPGETVQGLAHD